MKIARDWATPLTMGIFGLMALTGGLMFFHLETGLNKVAHEWLGWGMVVAAIAHATVNWASVKRYFVSNAKSRAILVTCLVVTLATFFPMSGGGKEGDLPPPVLAMKAVTRAPLIAVAPLAGKSVADMLSQLQQAGFAISDPQASLDSVTGGNRELEGKAIRVVFSTPQTK